MPSTQLPLATDLISLRAHIQQGTTTPAQEMERCIGAAQQQLQQDVQDALQSSTKSAESRPKTAPLDGS